ncbi:MAG: hypothetical protein IJ708_10670, partial [Clostridia bacterium]|nr:hypothetical protein [Clostridia bacterium]
ITWADGTSSTAPLRWDQIRRPNPVTEGEEVPVSDETDAGNAEYNETAEEIPEETADEADDMKGETATEETADSTTDATTDNPNAATAEEGDSKEETEIPPSHAVYLAKAIDAIQNVIIEDGDPIPKVYGVGSKRFKERQDGHNGNAQADMDQAC